MNKNSNSRQHKKIIVVSFDEYGYSGLWDSLSNKVEVKRVVLFNRNTQTKLPTFNKMAHIKDIIRALFSRNKLTMYLERDEAVILVGHITLPFLLHNFLRLRRSANYRVYVFSLFFHNSILMYLYGKFVKFLTTPKIKFIAFSKADIPLFKKYFNLLDSQIVYIPYGTGPVVGIQSVEGSYCFAGGYSNRNYTFLVNAFKEIEENLIICCSKYNKLPAYLPDNVEVFYDLPRSEFSKLVAGAKICIMPLYANSGASGQSVILQYMQFGKPIIATRVPAIGDYLNDQNAILIRSGSSKDLIKAVEKLTVDGKVRNKLGEKVQQQYFENFQGLHFEEKVLNVLVRSL